MCFARNDLASIGAIEVTRPPQAIRFVGPEDVDQTSKSNGEGPADASARASTGDSDRVCHP